MSFRTVLLLIAVVLPSVAACSTDDTMAETVTFRQMQEGMDANSLPLVNLMVGLDSVSRERFVHGEIEIADYQGLYCFSDKIDRKLLGLKKARQDDGQGCGVTIRGVLYKGVNWNDHDDIYLLSYKDALTDGTAWNSYELKYLEDYTLDGRPATTTSRPGLRIGQGRKWVSKTK